LTKKRWIYIIGKKIKNNEKMLKIFKSNHECYDIIYVGSKTERKQNATNTMQNEITRDDSEGRTTLAGGRKSQGVRIVLFLLVIDQISQHTNTAFQAFLLLAHRFFMCGLKEEKLCWY
jgi:hypothetical protein